MQDVGELCAMSLYCNVMQCNLIHIYTDARAEAQRRAAAARRRELDYHSEDDDFIEDDIGGMYTEERRRERAKEHMGERPDLYGKSA